MRGNLIIALVAAVVIAIIITWWMIQLLRASETPPPPLFNELRRNFDSYPTDLWMTDNLDRFNQELRDSPYWYRILDSTGHIIYSNRYSAQVMTYKVRNTTEYIAASSIGQFSVFREGQRHLAIRVNDRISKYRIVHITGAGV